MVYTERPDDGGRYRLIFRAWYINKLTGVKMIAKEHGKRAWPLWIKVA